MTAVAASSTGTGVPRRCTATSLLERLREGGGCRRGAGGRRGLGAAAARRRCAGSTRTARSRARSPAAASRAPSSGGAGDPRVRRRAAARHVRHLRRAGRHRRPDVRRDRPRLHPRDRAPTPASAMIAALEAVLDERPAAVATLLDGEHAGREAVRRRRARRHRSAAGALLDQNVEREARRACSAGPHRHAHFGDDGASLGTGLRVHVTAHAEPPQMVVFGAIDFSSALAPLAKRLGYRVTIADPRSAFLSLARASRARRGDDRLARRGARRRRARPARRGARLHARPQARRPGADRRAAAPTPATSARSAAARRRRPQAPPARGAARPTSRDRARLRARAGWTSAPRRSRRRRSPCSPRSSRPRRPHRHLAARGRGLDPPAPARRRLVPSSRRARAPRRGSRAPSSSGTRRSRARPPPSCATSRASRPASRRAHAL